MRTCPAGLRRQSDVLSSDTSETDRMAIALSPRLATAMALGADRRGAATCDRIASVQVERERARYGAWYEMFPRSAGSDPVRGATFDEAARRLPTIAALGFDVVYLPPVHPIGRSFRKGRNNALVAAAGDPGSPWAIGAPKGGHMAVDPDLGGIDAFDRFGQTAQRLGLEIALDLALQASPDHPYVQDASGVVQAAARQVDQVRGEPAQEVPGHLSRSTSTAASGAALWHEMLEVVHFWIDHGVRIFRVDNPHTKPFRFWQWLIARSSPPTIRTSCSSPRHSRGRRSCGSSRRPASRSPTATSPGGTRRRRSRSTSPS